MGPAVPNHIKASEDEQLLGIFRHVHVIQFKTAELDNLKGNLVLN